MQVSSRTSCAFFCTFAGLALLIQPAQALPNTRVLHVFETASDGANPYVGLILASDGSYYGVTANRGDYQDTPGEGTIFRLTPSGVLTTLFSFDGFDGEAPEGALIQGKDGRLYGTTTNGGEGAGGGTVFAVHTDGSSFRTLHLFSGTDGRAPIGALWQASSGRLYGTTASGGASDDGTLFAIDPDGKGFTSLHSFSGTDGDIPEPGLTLASNGMLYGTTGNGGSNGDGTLFRMTSDGSGFASLYSFTPAGNNPAGLLAANGQLYGLSEFGGANSLGSLFEIGLDGTGFNTVYSFTTGDGEYPSGSPVQGPDSRVYGNTTLGGAHNYGTVFALPLVGSSFVVLHSFDGVDGSAALGSLILGSDGLLHGTAVSGGGPYDGGECFSIGATSSSFAIDYAFHEFGYQPSATRLCGRSRAWRHILRRYRIWRTGQRRLHLSDHEERSVYRAAQLRRRRRRRAGAATAWSGLGALRHH